MRKRVEIYVRTEKVAQQTLIDMLKELCDGAKTELRIYDVQNFKGRLRARLQRVKIPTIISGQSRIESTVSREQVQFLLKQRTF